MISAGLQSACGWLLIPDMDPATYSDTPHRSRSFILDEHRGDPCWQLMSIWQPTDEDFTPQLEIWGLWTSHRDVLEKLSSRVQPNGTYNDQVFVYSSCWRQFWGRGEHALCHRKWILHPREPREELNQFSTCVDVDSCYDTRKHRSDVFYSVRAVSPTLVFNIKSQVLFGHFLSAPSFLSGIFEKLLRNNDLSWVIIDLACC